MMQSKRQIFKVLIWLFVCLILICNTLFSQKHPSYPLKKTDTFFLAKKKGLFGRLYQSICRNPSTNENAIPAEKNVNDFMKYRGKMIRLIVMKDISFGRSVSDTSYIFSNYITKAANFLHHPTHKSVVNDNLFFKEGDILNPYLIAENIRYLRSLSYLQDAKIEIKICKTDSKQVDVTVYYKDVFPLGVAGDASTNEVFVALQDNNLLGTGQQLNIENYYDLSRKPHYGCGVEYMKRNLLGSFFNASVGYKNIGNSYSEGKKDETYLYFRAELPLVSPYYSWTGGGEVATHYNKNCFSSDSIFKSNLKYAYHNIDLWAGYNLNGSHLLKENTERKVKHFVALRLSDFHFSQIPTFYKSNYNALYATSRSLLGSYTLFKQEYYHTGYIYGFGRNEDVPEGYNMSLIGGMTEKDGYQRPYCAINIEGNYFNLKKDYFDYIIKLGSYQRGNKLEDVSVLLDLESFTRLRKMGTHWYNRLFLSGSVAHQFNRFLDNPLTLNSIYGLPQFNADSATLSTTRATLNCQEVFFNRWKLAGFNFAPFLFTNFTVLKTDGNHDVSNVDGYLSTGFGIRTRNESLVFGTLELRLSYYPRTTGSMKPFNITIISDLKYKYNSQYITRPDFVGIN